MPANYACIAASAVADEKRPGQQQLQDSIRRPTADNKSTGSTEDLPTALVFECICVWRPPQS